MIYKTDTVMNCTSKIFDKIITYFFPTATCIESDDINSLTDTSQYQLNKFVLQVKELQQHPDAASRCCGFLARAHHQVQLSGRHCIGFRCSTSVTSLR